MIAQIMQLVDERHAVTFFKQPELKCVPGGP